MLKKYKPKIKIVLLIISILFTGKILYNNFALRSFESILGTNLNDIEQVTIHYYHGSNDVFKYIKDEKGIDKVINYFNKYKYKKIIDYNQFDEKHKHIETRLYFIGIRKKNLNQFKSLTLFNTHLLCHNGDFSYNLSGEAFMNDLDEFVKSLNGEVVIDR